MRSRVDVSAQKQNGLILYVPDEPEEALGRDASLLSGLALVLDERLQGSGRSSVRGEASLNFLLSAERHGLRQPR